MADEDIWAQEALFEMPEPWEEEWQDMPEYISERKRPFREIVMKFRSLEDVQKFSDLIGQKFTYETRWCWYPKLEIQTRKDKCYVYEES